jgi:hypothetical protein
MSPQDWLTASQILATVNLQFADFPSQSEAIKVAMQMVQENKQEYGHDFPPKESAVSPLLHKYWYVTSRGRLRTWTVEERTDVVLSTSDGSSSKAIAEMLNPREATKTSVKIECAEWVDFKQHLKILGSAVTALTKQQQMAQRLGQKLVVACRQDPSKEENVEPIQTALFNLSDFIQALQLALAEAEIVKAGDEDLLKQLDKLRAMAEEAAHHQSASKELVRKIGRLLT